MEKRRVASLPYRATQRSPEVEPGNRRLIRPSLNEMKDQRPRKEGQGPLQKKATPPDQTNAENFYYLKQMQSKTPMTIVLKDGEEIKGVIEWYDKTCLKVNRDGEPNLLVFKSNIKYMYKV
jgi:host factor-I protein